MGAVSRLSPLDGREPMPVEVVATRMQLKAVRVDVWELEHRCGHRAWHAADRKPGTEVSGRKCRACEGYGR